MNVIIGVICEGTMDATHNMDQELAERETARNKMVFHVFEQPLNLCDTDKSGTVSVEEMRARLYNEGFGELLRDMCIGEMRTLVLPPHSNEQFEFTDVGVIPEWETTMWRFELLGIDRNNWDVGGIPAELEHMQLKIDR